MATYAYLLLALWFLCFWIVIAWIRPDLRRRMMYAGVGGAIGGPVSEFWYFQDYWLPETTVGIGHVSPEDVLFGWAVAGISVALYDVVFQMKPVAKTTLYRRIFRIRYLVLFVVAMMLLWNTWLGFNSVLVSEAAFFTIAVAMLIARPDLLRVSLTSGVLLTVLMVPAYIVLMQWVFPGWWDSAWIIRSPLLRSLVILGIPLTEFLWYFTWGMMAGILFDVREGTAKEHIG